MSVREVQLPWPEFPNCPCNCVDKEGKPIQGLKLQTRHDKHLVGCTCRVCTGRRSKYKGQRRQSAVLKDAARAQGVTMEIAPTHEEQARLLVHYESKSGVMIPKGLRGDTMRHWEDQARNFAQRQVPTRKWALVFTFPGKPRRRRLWMDYDEYLALVSEIQELP